MNSLVEGFKDPKIQALLGNLRSKNSVELKKGFGQPEMVLRSKPKSARNIFQQSRKNQKPELDTPSDPTNFAAPIVDQSRNVPQTPKNVPTKHSLSSKELNFLEAS